MEATSTINSELVKNKELHVRENLDFAALVNTLSLCAHTLFSWAARHTTCVLIYGVHTQIKSML